MHRFFEDELNVYMILELCQRKSLEQVMRRRRYLHEIEVRYYTVQMLHAIKFMHSQGIIHRSLNPGNLMISDRMEVKIGDFGLAERLTDERPRRYSLIGDPEFMAPEIIDRNIDDGHGYECDLWNLGIIIYMLLTGEVPFEGTTNRDVFDRILTLDYTFESTPERPLPEVSEDAKQFIDLCLQVHPKDRPSIEDLLWHPFINGLV